MIIEMISTLFILSISVFLEYDFNTVYIKCLRILSRLGKTNMILEIEAKKQETECECLDFMNGAYGNCKKDYKGKGKICYVRLDSSCKDKEWSYSANGYFSWIACA